MRVILGIAAVGAVAAAVHLFSPEQTIPLTSTEATLSSPEVQAVEVSASDVAPTAALQAGVTGAARATVARREHPLIDDLESASAEVEGIAFFEDQYDNQSEIVTIGEYIDPASDVLTVEPVVAIGEFLDPESPQS